MIHALSLTILAAALLTSCSHRKDNSPEPMRISLGVYDDGMPFLGWDGVLYNSVIVNGTVTFPTGSNLVASLGESEDDIDVHIDVIAKMSSDETLSIKGSYKSKVPFELTFLGLAGAVSSAGKEDTIVSFEESDGEINIGGRLIHYYEKPENPAR